MKHDIATPYTSAYVILRKDGKIACVLRQNTGYADGYYGLLSGKVEHDETYSAAAVREAKEEGGVDIEPADLKHVITGHRKAEDSIWVDVIFEVTKWKGEAYNAEPDKHSELAWLDPDNLPENTIAPLIYYLKQIAAGNQFAEFGWDKEHIYESKSNY